MAKTQQNTKNIIIGAAAFYVTAQDSTQATFDPTLPTGLTTAPTSTSQNSIPVMDAASVAGTGKWRDVGYTMEGVEVSYEPDFGEVEVDQLLDAAKLFKQSIRVNVNTTLAEATLENLVVVWGQQSTTLASNVLDIASGELGDEPTERGLIFVGPAPRTSGKNDRVYHVTRALQTESTSHALRRNEATGLPVAFRLLPDASTSNSRYGTIRDRARFA